MIKGCGGGDKKSFDKIEIRRERKVSKHVRDAVSPGRESRFWVLHIYPVNRSYGHFSWGIVVPEILGAIFLDVGLIFGVSYLVLYGQRERRWSVSLRVILVIHLVYFWFHLCISVFEVLLLAHFPCHFFLSCPFYYISITWFISLVMSTYCKAEENKFTKCDLSLRIQSSEDVLRSAVNFERGRPN